MNERREVKIKKRRGGKGRGRKGEEDRGKKGERRTKVTYYTFLEILNNIQLAYNLNAF